MEKEDKVYLEGLKNWLNETKDEPVEKMESFFTKRIDGYEKHMINIWREYYKCMSNLIPKNTQNILDIGCGTGIELDYIFKKFPSVNVTGIDLTKTMLDELEKKHGDKNLKLICGDYFIEPFGIEKYDTVISFQTLHHFKQEKKVNIFEKIYKCLNKGGCYIECDYIAKTEEIENLLFLECERRKERDNVGKDVFVHFDTPLTLEHEINAMKKAGFEKVELLENFKEENTVIIIARK